MERKSTGDSFRFRVPGSGRIEMRFIPDRNLDAGISKTEDPELQASLDAFYTYIETTADQLAATRNRKDIDSELELAWLQQRYVEEVGDRMDRFGPMEMRKMVERHIKNASQQGNIRSEQLRSLSRLYVEEIFMPTREELPDRVEG